MNTYTTTKQLVLEYFKAVENATEASLLVDLKPLIAKDYDWRASYPFREQNNLETVVDKFWRPLKKSLHRMQRRQDIFIGGNNLYGNHEEWTMSMGHFMGNFNEEWLGIKPTKKMISLRYAEFTCVENGKITKSGIFFDLIGFMQQAGVNPLPPETGQYFIYPGPRTHDGLLFEDAPSTEAEITLNLMNKMVDELSELNKSGSMSCPPEILEKSWSKDMIWYGPAGIGASYTIRGYQRGHQLPFRQNLGDKVFNGHVCRFAEGNYACFFGWPNLSNSPLGGFLGLPGGAKNIEMQVVDVYRREGDKLVENWVIIDLPYWLNQQGLDILDRTNSITNSDFDYNS